MRVLACQRVPVEPGVELGTDVYLPDGPGPWPVLLARTPYNRQGLQGFGAAMAARGYAAVTQDCRGRYDSTGWFTPVVHEGDDGHAALDWIANQRWCNGRIGMHGLSYPAMLQTPAAAKGHEALKCIAPAVTPGSFFRDWIRYDGCFALANAIRWSLTHCSCNDKPPLGHFTWSELNALPTLDAIEARAGFMAPHLRDWVAHDTEDDYWQAIDQDRMLEQVGIPCHHTAGWFDHISRFQFRSFAYLKHRGRTDAARQHQSLLVMPTGHTNLAATGDAQRRYGDWDFGPEANLSILDYELQFHDFHLRGIDNGYTNRPAVKLFLMGVNRWMHFDDWPIQGLRTQAWHLDSDGSANMLSGDGRLGREAPQRDAADRYRYDPRHPCPTSGGNIYWGMEGVETGPADQRPLLTRPDVLVYRGEPLDQALAVIGEPTVDLVVSSDAEDTDVIAKLCVEEEDGGIRVLTLGSLRLRYRANWSESAPLERDAPTSITVRLNETGYVFPIGSRMVLLLTSSDYPRIAPHPNTMAKPLSGGAPVVARNSVLHGPGARSVLNLPVLER